MAAGVAITLSGCGSSGATKPLPTPSGAPPTSTYASTHVGASNTYRITRQGGGTATLTERVGSVHPAAGGYAIAIDISAGANRHVTLLVHPDGSYDAPLAVGVAIPGSTISGFATVPGPKRLANGAAYTEHASVRVTHDKHVRSVDARITHQGLGRHEVSVPAGNFQAQLVSETVTVPGADPVTIIEKLWLVEGIGMVRRTVTADSSGQSIAETWMLTDHASR